MAQQFTSGRFKSFLDDTSANVGGRLYTYASGTTTHKDAYTDATLTVPCTYVADSLGKLYIALNSRGEAQVWLGTGAYTMIDATAIGVTLDTTDGISDESDALSSELAAPTGANLIGYSRAQATVPNSIAQAIKHLLPNLKTDYGAIGDNTTDDADAWQSALSDGVAFYVPPSQYRISRGLVGNVGVTIVTDGRNCVELSWTDTTMTALSLITNDQCIVNGITFAAPGSCTDGGCILLTGAAGGDNAFSQILNNEFSNGYVQFKTTNAYAIRAAGNYFSGAVSAAAIIQNTIVPDAGDSEFTDFTISNLGAGAIGILQTSSGGLRIANGKILGGTQGIALNLSAGDATSILMIRDVSIELSTAAAITLLFGAGSSFALVTIDGYSLSQVPIGINIPGSGSTVAVTNLAIGAGVISLTASGTAGIIVNNVSNFTIAPTTITGNGGTPVGIVVGGFSAQGRVYPGSIQGCTTKVQNGSGTTVVVADDIQAGTQAVTCSTARGALFSGTAAVTFPVAFDSAPTVTCDPGAVSNGISAWPTAVTKTGFTLNAVSATTGGSGNANYIATGVV